MEQQSSSESPSIENLVELFKTNVSSFNRTANNSLEFEVRFGNETKKGNMIKIKNIKIV